MKALLPLVRLLQRALRAVLLRRFLAWMACALMFMVFGNVVSQLVAQGRVFRLGLVMTALSALPAFLLWPLPERLLLDRLRRIDEETVFEAFLEAEPGPVRDILQGLAAGRASALPFLRLPSEPVWSGLGGLWAAALACLLLVEAGSFLVLGRSLTLAPEPPAQAEGGRRIEEAGFSEFATEDPVVRQSRRDRRTERAGDRGENPVLGSPGTASSDRMPGTGEGLAALPGTGGSDALTKRRHGEREEPEGGMGPTPGPSSYTGEGHRDSSSAETLGQAGMVSPGEAGPLPQGAPPVPGRTGQGYEHTPDTRVPSPLLDYRSRFEARHAERTGSRLAASGRMGAGDLRAFQRRYFESFTLRAEVGAAEDPYVAQLKRRWNDVKGGFR